MQQEHPIDRFRTAVKSAERQGYFAIAALGATVLLRLVMIGNMLQQNEMMQRVLQHQYISISEARASDDAARVLGIVLVVMVLGTSALFLRWMHTTAVTGQQLGARYAWNPRDLVLSFVIPIVNFKRPYTMVTEMNVALEPDALPEPTSQTRADALGNYRNISIEVPARAGRISRASIGAWWTTFWAANILTRLATTLNHGVDAQSIINQNTAILVAYCVHIVSAVLAIVLVRALTARLNERFRRVRYAEPTVLHAMGISV